MSMEPKALDGLIKANDLLEQMREAYAHYDETIYKEDAFEYLVQLANGFARLDSLLSAGEQLPVSWCWPDNRLGG